MRRRLAILSLFLLASPALAAPPRSTVPIQAGQKIYLDGVLSTGEPLRGHRPSAVGVEAATAACASCHRRSGLGELEGRSLVPPITGPYLYRPRSADQVSSLESAALTMAEPGARVEVLRQAERSAYTDATLARAIREGIGPNGRPLDPLMPRFPMGDADMASLIAYLKQLSKRPSPGVGEDTLQFATIVTPDSDPLKRRGMLDVLEHFFGEQNVFTGGKGPPAQFSSRFTGLAHRWQLHVWELTGAPDTWQAQLNGRLAREPVFAVISGIGGRTWEPVHRFCQQSGVPCLFPNVDLPVAAEDDFYDVYFSKGVLLEAQLVADRLQGSPGAAESERAGGSGQMSGQTPGEPARQRIVQIYRRGDIGEDAAGELRRGLLHGRPGIELVDRALEPESDATRLHEAVSDFGSGDVLVLWLRPGDIRALPAQPPAAGAVFMSGILGGLDRAPLPAAWRTIARMTYPFDLPDRRRARMDYSLGWMQFKHVSLVDERTQTDTLIACLATAETVSMIGRDLVRDHLVETLELHLGTRLVDGYYPRLGLAAGQRFASKGGFVVRFDPDGRRVVADGEWTVP